MRLNLGNCLLLISILLVGIKVSHCWESYELDLFDLVEEIGQNFYEFLGISQDSDSNELRKAYRKLSLLWHPDRNSEPDAEKKFRNIVSVYEVLKDEQKRARYEEILENGLPDWRQPIYYFRRVRKLTTIELSIAISIIISIGHYFVLWAQHFEKKLAIEDRMDEVKKKLEKKQKKKKNFAELDEIDNHLQNYYDTLPSPVMKDTLPYRFVVWSFNAVASLALNAKEAIKAKFSKSHEVKSDETDVIEDKPEEKPSKKKNDSLHLQLNPKKIEKSDISTPVVSYDKQQQDDKADKTGDNSQKKVNQEWTDKDKSELIKAIVKYPAGASNRWNKIGELLNRTPQECIQMEKQMKTNFNSSSYLNAATWSQTKTTVLNHKEEPTISVKLDENSNETKSDDWSQEQQFAFEKALKEFSKDVLNRWDRIAERVSNKTKDDCMNRYKTLCAALKKKQQQA